ncbi:hypothetical protein [Cellulophaga sp. E6(2014)]|uniref:hypothetical protein n=1 Tax=Cellulophaga sp. E6(2014) TaxID=1495334 RepID=UPI00051D927A|nr:hypothetical protein [Cellulophaga sp. E6(2014)]KGK29172.1 hypothetical protein EL45_18150 [Cellulophaga sp. E6(2014)]
MKKTILFILVLVGALHALIAQRYKTHTTVIDFNKDTVLDTLINYYEYGSACSGGDASIINGKTKEKLTLYNEGCYSSFMRLIRVPTALNLEINAPFLKVLKDTVLPKKRSRPDSSLNWLLSGSLSLKVVEEHPLFDRIAAPKTNWIPNELTLPEAYYITVSGDTLQKLDRPYGNYFNQEYTTAFLVYYPIADSRAQLANLTPIIKNTEYEIYKTSHCVFVKKGKMYKWLFISDSDVMGAPDRHSWQAINQIQLIDNYVIIHQDVPPDNVYNIQIVNIETQKVARLKFEPCHETMTNKRGMDTFEIRNKKLLFTAYGDPKVRIIPLKQLFHALDQF